MLKYSEDDNACGHTKNRFMTNTELNGTKSSTKNKLRSIISNLVEVLRIEERVIDEARKLKKYCNLEIDQDSIVNELMIHSFPVRTTNMFVKTNRDFQRNGKNCSTLCQDCFPAL